MRWIAGPALCVGLLAVSAGARADDCPGATQWRQAHLDDTPGAAAPRDEARVPDDPALRTQLQQRVDADQQARRRWLAAPLDRALGQEVAAIDADNLRWLKSAVDKGGFPSRAQVGETGVHLAWILLQHADRDPAWQAQLLPVLAQRHADGELPANDLARLTDRVLRRQGKPQRYGTQFDWASRHFELPQPSVLAEIDTHRARLGLMPLADYACLMNSSLETGRH